MNALARYTRSENFNHPCSNQLTMANRELSAFLNSVTQLFGSEQAKLSAEDWLQELRQIEGLPASAHEWRLITTKVSTRLASRVRASSLSTELQIA